MFDPSEHWRQYLVLVPMIKVFFQNAMTTQFTWNTSIYIVVFCNTEKYISMTLFFYLCLIPLKDCMTIASMKY